MEYQLLDRMSDKRFCGLSNAPNIPDRTTVWVFENRIGEAGAKVIFDGVGTQLLKKGFIARGGQIIDAALVPAPKQHFTKDDHEMLKEGAMLTDWSPAKRRQKDIDATWTKKHGKRHFGYKLSLNVDKRHKFIRRLVTDTACTHDSQHFAAIEQMGGKLIRTIGQARANFAMTMMAACYNLKRLAYCLRVGIVPA
jgi:IS5 family transposase